MTMKCHIQTWNKCISNIDTKNKYHFKCNIIFYWTLMVMEYTRYSFLSPMISKENLIEWKVSCLCLFTECLLQSPGSSICCGKEWVAKCQCEWLMVWSPGERCDVYEVSANNTAQCKQGPGKKHSDLATRTLNNGHLMGTPRELCRMINTAGHPHSSAGSALLSVWTWVKTELHFPRISAKLSLFVFISQNAVRNALAI